VEALVMHIGKREVLTRFRSVSLKGEDHSEDLSIDERIMLK
jgi:hypothetical protein